MPILLSANFPNPAYSLQETLGRPKTGLDTSFRSTTRNREFRPIVLDACFGVGNHRRISWKLSLMTNPFASYLDSVFPELL
jgi:hypothetical protein